MRWFLLSFSLTVLIMGGCSRAFAQAVNTPWARVEIESVAGVTRGHMYPNPGVPGNPSTWVIKPSAVGGVATRTAGGGAVAWVRGVPIQFTSAATGTTQTLTALATRTATKEAIVKAAAKTALRSNPLGMTIMIGMAATEIFKWENGQLKMKLVEEESTQEEHYAPTMSPCWKSGTSPSSTPTCSSTAAASALMSCSAITQGHCINLSIDAAAGGCSGSVCYYKWNSTQNGSNYTGFFFDNPTLQCLNGGSLVAGQCVKPGHEGCPDGYQVVPELSGDYRCAPITPLSAPDYPATEQVMQETIGDLTGSDASKLDDVANWWEHVPDGQAEPIQTGDIAASGPSQGQPTTTTAPTANGGTKETIVQPHYTYQNHTVNITENVTNIYRNENGEEVGREEGQTEEPVASVTDGSLPDVPDFYTQKYPEGLGGVWTEKSGPLKNNPFTALLTSLQGNFGDGGQCPSWTLPSPLMGLSFDGQLQMPCWIWDVLGVIFVVSSLFAARRIIFGG